MAAPLYKQFEGRTIPLEAFMDNCLRHYYQTRNALGSAGDFVTAPEISQLFGESIGLWFLQQFMDLDLNRTSAFVELGAGRGCLIKDILRTFNLRPEYLNFLEFSTVEIHPVFQELQKKAVAPIPLSTYASIGDLLTKIQGKPLFCVANEFFDTYPIAQYVFNHNQWYRRMITFQNSQGHWVLEQGGPPADYLTNYPPPQENDVLEICPALDQAYQSLVNYIATHGGAIIAIDYGYDCFSFGETFQAVQQHQYKNPLENPGDVDLTAHINFARLRQISTPLYATVIPQGEFLSNQGIHLRAAILMQHNPSHKISIQQQLDRLTTPQEMGELFKVIYTICQK